MTRDCGKEAHRLWLKRFRRTQQGGRPMDDRARSVNDETDEWLDALDSVEAFEGLGKVDEILDHVVTSARRKGARLPFAGQHGLHQHHPARAAAAPSRRPQARDDDPALRPLERRGDRGQGQQGILGARRPHRQLPVGRDPLRHRLHAFLARARPRTTAATSSTSRAIPRPASTPAPSSRGGSPRSSCSISARRSAARACRPIRIPG